MNYNKEPYPLDLAKLLVKANEIAAGITLKLNEKNCPALGDLYKIKSGKTSRNASKFNELGYKPSPDKIDFENGKTKNEYKGIYVFGEEINGVVRPVYVGISRTVYRRLRQHGWGKKNNECSLAYLKARKDDKSLTRATVVDKQHLLPKKEIIRAFKVVLISVIEDYELYFLEAALAGILKTKWNSFRTH